MSKRFVVVPAVLVCALVVGLPGGQAQAGVYPTNKCVSAKLKEAGKKCKGILKAWSTWDKSQDNSKRDLKIGKIVDKFTDKWAKADDKAAAQDAACADTTVDVATAEGLVDAAVASIVNDVNSGLSLPSTCGAKLLKEAAKKCDAMIKSYSKFIKNPAKDPQRAKLGDGYSKASTKFDQKFQAVLDDACSSNATTAGIEATIDQLRDDLVAATTISPAVSDTQFDTITHPAFGPGHEVKYEGDVLSPYCQDKSPYSFFVKRGIENKLMMYYQGGGACWSGATCCLQTCDQNVNVGGSDNPNNGFGTGFADLSNPNNPFRNWTVVFVSYCSCDVHWGDNELGYGAVVGPGAGGGGICQALTGVTHKDVSHRGWDNAKLAEKFAREHFLDPEEVFVTGSSAGGYGAILHGVPVSRIYAASNVNVLGDASNGVITTDFLTTNFPHWGAEIHLPDLKLAGVSDVPITQLSIPKFIEAAALAFPDVNWANYSTAFDGGTGGQGGFYHVMVNDTLDDFGTVTGVWPQWWDSICMFNTLLEQQAADTEVATAAGNDNYRSYIGSGSRHTMFGSNKVYDSTLGGVDTIVDFVNKMRIKPTDVSWTSQNASPNNVLIKSCSGGTNNGESCPNGITDCPDQGGGTSCSSGDPKPSPLECPFKTSGADTVVDCSVCP
jgi:Pectinacetylesterase